MCRLIYSNFSMSGHFEWKLIQYCDKSPTRAISRLGTEVAHQGSHLTGMTPVPLVLMTACTIREETGVTLQGPVALICTLVQFDKGLKIDKNLVFLVLNHIYYVGALPATALSTVLFLLRVWEGETEGCFRRDHEEGAEQEE